MPPHDIARFALQAARGHPVRTTLGLFGVAIGVAAVVLLIGLGEGARLYVTQAFTGLGSDLLMVAPGQVQTLSGLVASGVSQDLTLSDASAIRALPQVRKAAPLSLGTATAAYGHNTLDVNIVGTNSEWIDVRGGQLTAGQFLPAQGEDRPGRFCVLGAAARRELFGDRNPLGESTRIGQETFRVVGVMAPRGVSIGLDLDLAIFVPVQFAIRMFDRPGLFRIFVATQPFVRVESTQSVILSTLTQQRPHRDVTVFTQDAMRSTFDRVIRTLTLFLVTIATISLGVAGLGIMNLMLVSVSEREGEIGLMKAIGAANGQILLLFLAEALVLAVSGALVGVAVAYGIAPWLSGLYPGYVVEPPLWAGTASVLLAVVVGSVFGIIPARKAARRDPVAALTRRAA
jgi:putative ABC transport system permease protein